MASANKVIELYYTRPMIVDRADCKNAGKKVEGRITFDHVSLKLSGQELLHDISLDIAPGETIAIMGNTGSGKTMLASLIPRLYDISGGSLSVDGVPFCQGMGPQIAAQRHRHGHPGRLPLLRYR